MSAIVQTRVKKRRKNPDASVVWYYQPPMKLGMYAHAFAAEKYQRASDELRSKTTKRANVQTGNSQFTGENCFHFIPVVWCYLPLPPPSPWEQEWETGVVAEGRLFSTLVLLFCVAEKVVSCVHPGSSSFSFPASFTLTALLCFLHPCLYLTGSNVICIPILYIFHFPKAQTKHSYLAHTHCKPRSVMQQFRRMVSTKSASLSRLSLAELFIKLFENYSISYFIHYRPLSPTQKAQNNAVLACLHSVVPFSHFLWDISRVKKFLYCSNPHCILVTQTLSKQNHGHINPTRNLNHRRRHHHNSIIIITTILITFHHRCSFQCIFIPISQPIFSC